MILPNPVFCSFKRKREKQLWLGLRKNKLERPVIWSISKVSVKAHVLNGNMIRMMSQFWQSSGWTTVQSKDLPKINKKRKIYTFFIHPAFLVYWKLHSWMYLDSQLTNALSEHHAINWLKVLQKIKQHGVKGQGIYMHVLRVNSDYVDC